MSKAAIAVAVALNVTVAFVVSFLIVRYARRFYANHSWRWPDFLSTVAARSSKLEDIEAVAYSSTKAPGQPVTAVNPVQSICATCTSPDSSANFSSSYPVQSANSSQLCNCCLLDHQHIHPRPEMGAKLANANRTGSSRVQSRAMRSLLAGRAANKRDQMGYGEASERQVEELDEPVLPSYAAVCREQEEKKKAMTLRIDCDSGFEDVHL